MFTRPWINLDDKCPICQTEWTITESPTLGNKVIWKDCKLCNKTEEQILEEYGKLDFWE